MRSLAAVTLVFEAIVLALVTPVMISISGVPASTALPVCLGLAALALLATGLLRNRAGYVLGWLVQFGAIGLGFVVPVMFVLGALYAGLWVAAILLGRRIDEAKRAHAEAAR
jgi:Protein of unknown function (DUF4233)